MSQPDRSRAFRAARAALTVSLALFGASVAYGATPAKSKVYRCGNVFQDLPCPETKGAEIRPVVAATTVRDPAACIAAAKTAGKADTNDCTPKAPRESATATQTK